MPGTEGMMNQGRVGNIVGGVTLGRRWVRAEAQLSTLALGLLPYLTPKQTPESWCERARRLT